MPYAIKKPDGTEQQYRLEDIIAGAATGELRRDWLVRRIGDDAWMSIETLLHIREDSSRPAASRETPLSEGSYSADATQPSPHKSPEVSSPIVLQPRISEIGGWLVLLIFGLIYWGAGGAGQNIKSMSAAFAPFLERFPSLRPGLDTCSYFQWGIAFISLYCAYVLTFRKPAAVKLAKRGFICMAVLQTSATLLIPLLAWTKESGMQNAAMPLHEVVRFVLGSLLVPLLLLAICYAYLVRSKRVRDTYTT